MCSVMSPRSLSVSLMFVLATAGCREAAPCPPDRPMRRAGVCVVACVPTTEACNGRDDDCDLAIDEAGGAPYYADLDGDGRGAGPALGVACEPPDGTSEDDDDCDDQCVDCLPGATERCDALDNDCDDDVDDGFACARGELAIACTTACGSMGVGPCSEVCGPPDSASCTPPSEICNGRDDDCDGLTDEGLQRTSDSIELTDSVAPASERYPSRLAPLDTGGVAVFYDGGARVRRFDADGVAIGGAATFPFVGGVGPFVYGDRILVAWRGGIDLRGAVLDGTLATVTPPRAIVDIGDLVTDIRAVTDGSQALIAYNSAGFLGLLTAPFPALDSFSFIGESTSINGYDLVADPAASRAYLAFADTTTFDYVVLSVSDLHGEEFDRIVVSEIDSTLGAVAAAFGRTSRGRRVAVAYRHGAVSGPADRIAVVLWDVDNEILLPTIELGDASPPDIASRHPIDVSISGGRVYVSYLRQAATDTTSTLSVAEITETDEDPIVEHVVLDAVAQTNPDVWSAPSGAGGVFIGAGRTGSFPRMFVRGCF